METMRRGIMMGEKKGDHEEGEKKGEEEEADEGRWSNNGTTLGASADTAP